MVEKSDANIYTNFILFLNHFLALSDFFFIEKFFSSIQYKKQNCNFDFNCSNLP